MVLADLLTDLMSSVKNGNSVRVETLRFLISDVRNMAIAKYANEAEQKLAEADILDVVKKQVKTHRESVDAFTNAGRLDLAAKETAQLEVLMGFLPKEMSDEELKKLLAPVVSGWEKNPPAGGLVFGLLMKSAMAVVAGRADGGRVASILRQMTV
ncbi:GatB/YqeY domain-containing protein [Candidatus Gottesmanbacteria bacterium]|nr:GatB/YqeY domain-containing protein [Candidatus Gottesmanbacteria bacterium]